MGTQVIPPSVAVNPLVGIDFDVTDPNGWYQYVAESLVLTGQARSTGETYAREIRIQMYYFDKKPTFMLSESDVRSCLHVIRGLKAVRSEFSTVVCILPKRQYPVGFNSERLIE